MVAAGRFAPGHLGELTQLVPFGMVDEALADAGCRPGRGRQQGPEHALQRPGAGQDADRAAG
jgi:hypothetical protein